MVRKMALRGVSSCTLGQVERRLALFEMAGN
jgi:hypothetical protein